MRSDNSTPTERQSAPQRTVFQPTLCLGRNTRIAAGTRTVVLLGVRGAPSIVGPAVQAAVRLAEVAHLAGAAGGGSALEVFGRAVVVVGVATEHAKALAAAHSTVGPHGTLGRAGVLAVHAQLVHAAGILRHRVYERNVLHVRAAHLPTEHTHNKVA